MGNLKESISRISKLEVDMREIPFEEADRRRAAHRVALSVGSDVAVSPTLQAALLTAANVCSRCFPGAVALDLPDGFDADMLLPLPFDSLLEAICSIGIKPDLSFPADSIKSRLVFGSRPDVRDGLQVSFNGWIGAVGPVTEGLRLPEHEGFTVAGVLAGALGAGEVFLRFARITQMAGYRTVGLSLWRPDLHWTDAEAIGPVASCSTGEYWLLGLGHLGQAYAWSISMLPFETPGSVNVIVQDFETISEANLGTGVLTRASDLGRFKSRIVDRWLKGVGINARIVDRPFDEFVHRTEDEPRLALCGFDSRGPRWALENAGFLHVINCGLGGYADDFEMITMQTLPHPQMRAQTEWPIGWADRELARIDRLAKSNGVYQAHAEKMKCGEIDLAGRAVAVPFVGVVAASLAIAETVRMQLGGVRCGSLRLQLDAPEERFVRGLGCYNGAAQPRIASQALRTRGGSVGYSA